MPVKVLFKCEFCAAEPDDETRRALEAQLQELLFGTYLDADPGHWLVWHGGGLYGRTRYACGRAPGRAQGPGPRALRLHRPSPLGDGAAHRQGPAARPDHGPQAGRARLVLAPALGPDGLSAGRDRQPRSASVAAAIAACPKEMPPSLGGSSRGTSTRSPLGASSSQVRSSSSRFWKTPPESTTVSMPRRSASAASAVAVAVATALWKRPESSASGAPDGSALAHAQGSARGRRAAARRPRSGPASTSGSG